MSFKALIKPFFESVNLLFNLSTDAHPALLKLEIDCLASLYPFDRDDVTDLLFDLAYVIISVMEAFLA